MTYKGEILGETVQVCIGIFEFTRCERPDGSAYGTGGKCRKGVEADKPDKEKVARVSRALSSNFDDFLSEFGGSRQRIMDESAENIVERISSTPRHKLDKFDLQRVISAKRLASLVEDINEFKAMGDEGKAAIKAISGTKEFFDDMKWRLVNERMMVTEGTLRLAWDNVPLVGKANAVLKTNIHGQSLIVVTEHPVPTKILKSDILSLKSPKQDEVIREVSKRNLLSLTSAIEDKVLNDSGYKSSMPDPRNTFSRYDVSEIKVFPLRVNNDRIAGVHPNILRKNISDSAQKAKADGKSFEEWVASEIDI